MTNAELDAIKQAADEKAWSELNKEDEKTKASINVLNDVIQRLEDIENQLVFAAEDVQETPEQDRILSLMRDAEELECNIRTQVRRMI